MKNNDYKNNFKKILKLLRQQNKLTQKSLGTALGYGYTAVSNYESGRNEPSINDLIKLADFFNVSVDFLIGHTCDVNNETKYLIAMKAVKIDNIIDEAKEKINAELSNIK